MPANPIHPLSPLQSINNIATGTQQLPLLRTLVVRPGFLIPVVFAVETQLERSSSASDPTYTFSMLEPSAPGLNKILPVSEQPAVYHPSFDDIYILVYRALVVSFQGFWQLLSTGHAGGVGGDAPDAAGGIVNAV